MMPPVLTSLHLLCRVVRGDQFHNLLSKRGEFYSATAQGSKQKFHGVTLPLDGTSSDEQAVILSGSAPVAVAGIAVNGEAAGS